MPAPLRLVTEQRVWAIGKDHRGNITRVLKDKLECGHFAEIKNDSFGRMRSANRRRCEECAGIKATMAKAGRI